MGKLPAPNYTQTPNALFDLMPEMGEAELRVSLAVCRKTFGWHKDRDRLSLSQLMDLTGMSKQGVLNGIEAGIERGWLDKQPDGDSFSYALLVNEVDNPSQRSGQVLVNEVDREDVNEVDTQKKEYKEREKESTPARTPEQERAFREIEQLFPLRLNAKDWESFNRAWSQYPDFRRHVYARDRAAKANPRVFKWYLDDFLGYDPDRPIQSGYKKAGPAHRILTD